MSHATPSTETVLPRTVQWAVITALLLGITGLAIHQPLLAGAALTGLFVGVGVVGLSSTPRRVTVAAMTLPVGLVAGVAGVTALGAGGTLSLGIVDVTIGGSAYAAGAALVATVLGIGLVGTITGSVSEESLSRATWTAMSGAGIGTVLVTVGYVLTTHEDAGTPLEAALFVAGDGAIGVAGSVILAAVALAAAALAVPEAAVTSPDRRERFGTRRLAFVVAVAVAAGAAVVLAGLVAAVLPAPVATAVLDNVLLRGLLAVIVALGFGAAGLGALVRLAWTHAEGGHNPSAAILLGTTLSMTGIVGTGLMMGISPDVLFFVPVLLFLAGGGLWGLQGLLDTVGGHVTTRETLPGALAVLCIAGAATIAGDVGGTTALGWSSLGVILTLGAGLFIYAVGTYGTDLTREVGNAGAGRTPQLVHVAYAGSVVAVGTVVALAGHWVAMAVAPAVSVAATIGVVSALAATVLAVQYLLR